MESLAHNQTNNKAILNPHEFREYKFQRLKMWYSENYPHDTFVNVATDIHLELIYRQNGRAIRDLIFFNYHEGYDLTEYRLCDKDEVDEESFWNIGFDEAEEERIMAEYSES